jgi:hypothetical protein
MITVIPSKVEESRGETKRAIFRDPSTSVKMTVLCGE